MGTSPQPAAHPLDPLTAGEIRDVAAALRRDRDVAPPRWRFASIELYALGPGGPRHRAPQRG